MQKQRSVARILGAVVGSLGLILVVICAYALKLAVTRYSDSNRIVSLTIASRDLTNTLVIFRLERGDTLSYLASPAPAPDSVMSSIAEQRATVQKNYAQALQSLASVDAPGLAEKLDKLRGIWAQLEELRPRAVTALKQEKGAREASLQPGWAKISDGFMDAIGDVTAHVDNAMALIDPVVDRPHALNRSVGDPLGERPVARVEAVARGSHRAIGVGAVFEDAPYDPEGGSSCGRGHARTPRRNSS